MVGGIVKEQFIMRCWYAAAWDGELAPGQMHAITICEIPLLIYRADDGEIIVLEDRCCHRMAPLSKGRIEDGCNDRCMYHGLKFNRSGKCIEIPGQDTIPDTAMVRRFTAAVHYGWIWVWLADDAPAEEGLLPVTSHYSQEGLSWRRGNIDYDTDYELINDNLTDFSHLSYVHAESFRSTEIWARKRPDVKPVERGIRVTRWYGADEAPTRPDAASRERFGEGASPAFAMYQTYDYLAPGVLLMYSAFFLPEAMPADGKSPPTMAPITDQLDLQAVTPMGPRSTRYFFSVGVRAGGQSEGMADTLVAVLDQAFAEDREMIHAQQHIIDLRPGNEVLTTADVGPVQFRAALRKLRKAEAA
jgi:vanillate O-demethylase monooxygenase subunit